MVVNAVATYGRSLIVLGMSLFSVRWVLGALGQVDFGLFAVVGGITAILSILSTVMVAGAARFFAYSIGGQRPEETRQWFCSALAVQAALGTVMLCVGLVLWDALLKWFLTIPPERLLACRWVYYFSVVGAAVTFMTSPYIGMFTAKQRVFELSAWGTVQAVLAFALAYALFFVNGDKLLVYAGGMVLCVLLVCIGQSVRAIVLYRECRIKVAYLWDFQRIKELVSFSWWLVFGVAGGMIRNQGLAVLLNVYHGPRMNSAFGIANQVAGAAGYLSQAVYSSIAPEITTREGSGNRAGMLRLASRACKFATVLGCLWAIPLFGTMDFVLTAWLKNPPAHAAALCKLVLLAFLIENLSIGYMGAVLAKGRIAAYQMTLGCSLMVTLPIAWVVMACGLRPEWAVAALVLTSTMFSTGRAWWATRLFGVEWRQWGRGVLLPVCVSIAPAVAVSLALNRVMGDSAARFLCTMTLAPLAMLLSLWRWGLDSDERDFGRQKAKKIWQYIWRRTSPVPAATPGGLEASDVVRR